jgi:DNA-binding MarR family transcriptional regulator
MVRESDDIQFGDLLRRSPGTISSAELAAALRIPVTTLADMLRRRTRSFTVTPTQSRVLSQLSAGDSLSISALAQSQDLAISSMTEAVNRLTDRGLARKEQSVDDRREVRVSITKEGLRQLRAALKARTDQLTAALDQLPPDDRERLAAALPALWRLAEIDPDIWPRLRSCRPTRAAS